MSSTGPQPPGTPPAPTTPPAYGTLPAYGTPPPPGSSMTAELPPEPPAPTAPVAVATPSASAAQPPVPPTAQPPAQPTIGHRGGVAAVRIIGVLVTAGLLAAGTGSMLFTFFSQSETVVTQVQGDITRLVTDGTTGDVRVRVGRAGEAVTVKETLHWTFVKPQATVPAAAAGTLTLAPRCDGWSWGPCATDLDVTVPPGTQLQLKTTTGDIRADAQGATVSARTTTGDVVVNGTGSTAVDAQSTTGDVTVGGDTAAARITTRTTTGDVTVTLTAVPADLTATATTGDVVVTVPSGHRYRVDIETTNGDQSVAPGLRDDAATEHLGVRSTTGDVTIKTG